MPIVQVSDVNDVRLDDYLRLTDTALRRRLEPERGLFIAEGELVVDRALRAGLEVMSVLCAQRYAERYAAAGLDVYAAPIDLISEVAGFHVHRGVLAAVRRPPPMSVVDVARTARRLIVVEDMTNPTNLGAIARSAAGLGFDGMLLSPDAADPLYRRAVRVSMGEVLTLPWARFDVWPAGLAEVRAAGFTIVALTPAEGAIDIRRAPAADRVALVVGTEGEGLSEMALAQADLRVKIPMARGVDSLNAAAAAAVACFAFGLGE
jgi:tRNA G18 (ribose-2'-O)-methylase SpoU